MSDPSLPRHCHPRAYASFVEALPNLQTTQGLVRAAVAIARHRLEDADPQRVENQLAALAERIRARVRQPSPSALIAHLHEVLFEEAGFGGNTSDYYDPRNSYLPSVLESRKGIPITLVLVYKAVAARLGLFVQGLNCPGHFLAELVTDDERLLIDPFDGGALLTRDEARQRLQQLVGAHLPADLQLFQPASHATWIVRMLRNLQNVYSMHDHFPDVQAMCELERLIDGSGRPPG